MKTKKKKWKGGVQVPWYIIIPGLFCSLTAHFIAPIRGAMYAFTNYKGIGSYDYIGFENFIEIFHSKRDRAAIFNTFKIAIPFVILTLFFGLLLALALKDVIKSRNVLRAIYFSPVVMIPMAVSQVWKFIFDYDGPLNIILRNIGLSKYAINWLGNIDTALWCVLLVLVWQNMGYTMVIFNAGLESIPTELYEAAAIDGASAWKRFRYITLPLLAPSITIAVLMMTITGLRVFDQIMSLTGGGPVNMTHTLASDFYYQTWNKFRYGYGSALALILTLLVSVVGILQVTVLSRKEEAVR